MISSDILRLITGLEERYPVESWIMDGIHIWPLIRIKLYGYLYAFRVDADKRRVSRKSRLAQHGPKVIRGLARFVRAYVSDYRRNLRPAGAVNAVFLSDGVSYTQLDGEWYEKFCDPLIERFRDRGMRCFLMSPLHEYYVPRHTPSMFVQPFVDLAIARALAASRLRAPREMNLSRFDEFRSELDARKIGIPLERVLNVAEDVARLRAVAAFYRSHLRRLRPAAAFVVSYYSIDNMAFNLACHELGIPAVDIQHGAEGDLHAAYGQWWKVPAEGYALLPAVFWCWSENEAAAIRRWNGNVRHWHDAVVGGHPWLALWQHGAAPFIARYDRRVREIKAGGDYAVHILVTLQYGLADATVLEPLLAAMRAAPASWRWWVRLHPAMLKERESLRELVRSRGNPHVELDAATDLPLYALLKHVDVHVTHSSYTTVEAEAYGVHSIVFSRYGAELLGDQLARGTAIAAFTGSEIVAGIASTLAKRNATPKQDRRHHATFPDMDRAIAEVLEFGARRAEHLCHHMPAGVRPLPIDAHRG